VSPLSFSSLDKKHPENAVERHRVLNGIPLEPLFQPFSMGSRKQRQLMHALHLWVLRSISPWTSHFPAITCAGLVVRFIKAWPAIMAPIDVCGMDLRLGCITGQVAAFADYTAGAAPAAAAAPAPAEDAAEEAPAASGGGDFPPHSLLAMPALSPTMAQGVRGAGGGGGSGSG
jgi:hypothetical protein